MMVEQGQDKEAYHLLGQQVYYGYPHKKMARVEAVLTESKLTSMPHFDSLLLSTSEYKREDHA